MKKLALAMTCLSASLLTSAAFGAQSGCDTPRNAFDQLYCSSTIFAQTDKDLNTTYGALRKQLQPAQQEALKQGQLAWIKKRDDECSYEKPNGYYVNLTCAVKQTQSRLDFLKARQRECGSTGCVTSKLGE
ncbi:lysozyme inhibitor LprI family protein [Pigmentiphaga litoralis]|uniref:lysozyme inhibitor LprI family protein n=1 Tax=Pigmentiphaga litoralis TaxID=516702 RepID=UPI003B42E927